LVFISHCYHESHRGELINQSINYDLCAILGSKDKEGKKSKKRDTKEAVDDTASRKKKKKSLLYVLVFAVL